MSVSAISAPGASNRLPLPQPPPAQGATRPGGLHVHRPVAERERDRGERELASARSTRPRRACPTFRPFLAGPQRDQLDAALIERTLSGDELQLYRDHADTDAARHLVLIRETNGATSSSARTGARSPLFASMLHVSNPSLFRRMAGPRAGTSWCATARWRRSWRTGSSSSRRSWPSTYPQTAAGCFAAPGLEPAQIDYLYSELTCVAW